MSGMVIQLARNGDQRAASCTLRLLSARCRYDGTSSSLSKYSVFPLIFLAQPDSWACAMSAASDSNPSVCMSFVARAGGQWGKVRWCRWPFSRGRCREIYQNKVWVRRWGGDGYSVLRNMIRDISDTGTQSE